MLHVVHVLHEYNICETIKPITTSIVITQKKNKTQYLLQMPFLSYRSIHRIDCKQMVAISNVDNLANHVIGETFYHVDKHAFVVVVILFLLKDLLDSQTLP